MTLTLIRIHHYIVGNSLDFSLLVDLVVQYVALPLYAMVDYVHMLLGLVQNL